MTSAFLCSSSCGAQGAVGDRSAAIRRANSRGAKSLGRFMRPDPSNAGAAATDPQSWNGYSYVRSNPLLYTDPDGLSFAACIKMGFV
jgi:RHS repeat-associated protein